MTLLLKKLKVSFQKKMYELEVKLREQKAKGIFFTDKQHALFSKLSKQKITKNFLTDPQYERLKNLRRSRDRLIRETDDLEANLKEMGESKILPANEESFFPRFLLKHKIKRKS
jgi:DNA-binding TFAR19-related protein (PDSD5 family)